MSLRGMLTDYSKGDSLGWFWRLYWLRKRTKSKVLRDVLTFLLNRSAYRHGGYVGSGADIQGEPTLPHGLHGVFISRYAGAVVSKDIPAGCTVVAQPPRILERE